MSEAPWRDPQTLEDLYGSGMSQPEVAEELGCDPSTVHYWMNKHEIDTRSGAEAHLGEEINVNNYQHELLKGILMSDGWVDSGGESTSPCLGINMTNKPFLEWFDGVMGNVATGVRLYKDSEKVRKEVVDRGFMTDKSTFQDIFILRTRRLPELQRYADWYGEDGKTWPSDLVLTPPAMKMLYVGDGSLATMDRGRPWVRIHTVNEFGNKEKLKDIFSRVGFDIRFRGDRTLGLTCDDSEKFFSYIGGPVPGFAYKWPDSAVCGECRSYVGGVK